MPGPEELKLLEPFKDRLPPEVFGEAYKPPVTDASGRYRPSIRMASKLLDEAGWRLEDGMRKNAKGETLDIEFLIEDPVTERILGPYAGKLSELGIKARIAQDRPLARAGAAEALRFRHRNATLLDAANAWACDAGLLEQRGRTPRRQR